MRLMIGDGRVGGEGVGHGWELMLLIVACCCCCGECRAPSTAWNVPAVPLRHDMGDAVVLYTTYKGYATGPRGSRSENWECL